MSKLLLRSILGALVGFILFALLSVSISKLYYMVMPGDWWINYYYAHVDDIAVGDDIPLTLCRHTRYSDVKLDATRTFLYYQNNGKFEPVGQYAFTPSIESLAAPCQTLHITADHQPDRAGTYEIRTSAVFYVEGYRKTIHYTTNEYHVSATTQSLQRQIERLQHQLEQLQEQLTSMQAIENRGATAPTPAKPARSKGTSSSQPAPPESTTQEPSQPNVIERILDNTVQAINRLVL